MGLRLAFSIGAFALCSAALGAQASTVAVGSLTFDDTAFIDTAELEQGTLVGGNNATSNMLGNTFGTSSPSFTNLRQNGSNPSEVVKVGFTDNTLGNDAGVDFVIWEALIPQAPLISLSLGGPTLAGTFLETFTVSGSANIHAYTYDLTDLGVADGQQVTNLLIAPPANVISVQVIAAAALNSGTTAPPAVPLPAGGVLLLSGVGLAALLRRRSRKSA